MLLHILARIHHGHAPEGAGEMRWAGITRQIGNIGDGDFRILHEIDRCFITDIGKQVSVGQFLVSQSALQCACTEVGNLCGEFAMNGIAVAIRCRGMGVSSWSGIGCVIQCALFRKIIDHKTVIRYGVKWLVLKNISAYCLPLIGNV